MILATLLLLNSAAATGNNLAEVVADLRGEPMSLFDWGLYQLEAELQSVRRHELDFVRVEYDPERERITVKSVFLVSEDEVKARTAARACYTRHHAIKLTLGVIDTDRIHLSPAAEFRMGTKFSHHNSDAYSELPDAAAIGKTLLDAIDVRVAISTNQSEFPFDQVIRCSGAALSQNVDYSGETMEDMIGEHDKQEPH